MTVKTKAGVTRSSGNVFRDLGFPPGKAEHLLVRADLMLRLEQEGRLEWKKLGVPRAIQEAA